MEDNAKLNLPERQMIIEHIFGETAVIESKDNDTYNARVSILKDIIPNHEENSALISHLEQRLLPLMKEHVIVPSNAGKIPTNWTSNNAESANHILKSASNWKSSDLCTFLKKLQDIVEGEFGERQRAIRDMGSFKLCELHRHHLIDIDSWAALCNDQQIKRLKRFNTDKGRTSQSEIISTNGQRTV